MRWILLRHGESEANAAGLLSGHRDVGLTPLGREQALRAGERLAGQPLERAVASDLRRAVETARLALGSRPVPLTLHPELRERSLGRWTGRRRDELPDPERLLDWDLSPPGGESYADLAARLVPFLAGLEAGAEGPVLVVAHGGVIRVALRVLDGLPADVATRARIPHAHPLVRDAPRGRWEAWLHERGA